MKLLENILVAVDFTESTEHVLRNTINFAKTFKAKVTLVHILPDDIDNKKVSDLIKNTVTLKLKEATENVANEGIETGDPVIGYGNYSDQIVDVSDKIGTNLIIVGSGNKSKDNSDQLGSTAETIIRKSHKPVFVVKNGETLTIKNIICPVDFSKESRRALNSAIIIARMVDAKLEILSVYPHFEYTFSNFDTAQINEARHLDHSKAFDLFLEGFNLIDLNFRKHIKGGNPSEEILKTIEETKSDLLIMGTTGKSGISRVLMGSVTEKVVRKVPCSFITVKNQDVVALELESKIQDIEKHYEMAQKLFNKGFFEEAIQQYKICVNINMMHLPSLKGIARGYEKIGDMAHSKKYEEMADRVFRQIENMKIEQEVREHIKR